MHVLKVCALVVAIVLAMRIASWAFAWLLRKVRVRETSAAISANILCFAIFVGWLYKGRIPGVSFEWDAAGFGAFVWAACLAIDLVALRRKEKALAPSDGLFRS